MIQDAMWDTWLNGDDASEESKRIVNELDKCKVVPIGEEYGTLDDDEQEDDDE